MSALLGRGTATFEMIRHDGLGSNHNSDAKLPSSERLQRERQLKQFAASLNNVGGLLYQKGDSLTAMQCLQEAVQTLMLVEDPSNKSMPPVERQREIAERLKVLTAARREQLIQGSKDNNNNKRTTASLKDSSSIPTVVAARAVASVSGSSSKTRALNPQQQQILQDNSCSNSSGTQPPVAKRDELDHPRKGIVKKDYADHCCASRSEEKKMPSEDDVARRPASEAMIMNKDGVAARNDDPSFANGAASSKPTRVPSAVDASYKAKTDELLDSTLDEATVLEPTNFVLGGIPGLFGMTSKMRGAEKKAEESMMVFSEPFLVQLNDNDNEKSDPQEMASEEGPDAGAFFVPLEQCSRAALFNMGLIHYQWKSIDSALQFFELSLSMAQPETSVLKFDPIILACVNNIGQIHLQKGRAEEAKGMFSDALSRGNSALVQLYGDEGPDSPSTRESCQSKTHKITSRKLRRFLVRTLMNMGFVHFFNCEYELALRTCLDAMRLLRPNMLELDAAALWYNIALSHHHNNELHEALEYLDKFLDVACRYLGVSHVQVASALHRKGLICFEMGNLYESTKPMLQALRIRKAIFGNKHLLVAESLCLLGKIYLDREEFRFAQNALEQALAIQKALNEHDSLCLDIAQTLIDLGRAYHSQGQLIDSLKSYTEVKALTKRMFGERHPYVARMQKIIGNIYLEQGKVDEAVFMFTNAMSIHLEQDLGIDYAVVQNPHVRVSFQQHPAAAGA